MRQPQLYPLIIRREHFMPERNAQISGEGMAFIASLRAAEKAGGMWLAFQDSKGRCAVKPQDIISFAQIKHIDWLSQARITVDFTVLSWGVVTSKAPTFCSTWMTQTIEATPCELWPMMLQHKNVQDLQQTLQKINVTYPELKVTNLNQELENNQVKSLCWRWLELLPLPINTKQRLLKSPSASLCIRYLGFILRQSDRFNQLPR
ncbi:hypothetical protein ACVFI8_04620 [Agarivorans sp. MS3-6]